MNSYELSRKFVDFSFENPTKIKPNHYALYFFAIEHCNRLGWKKEYGLPTTMTMEAIGIRSYNTYIKTFNELVDFGFFTLKERSKNQYSANIIELSNFNKALDKALDKAFIKHATKQSESTQQSICSIDKPINKETINQLNKEQHFISFWSKYPNKINRKDSKSKFLKLTIKEVDKIMATIDAFILHKPFKDYNHPNPTTYLNQKRWNDEIQGLSKPQQANENQIKYRWEHEPSAMFRFIEKDKAKEYFANQLKGGYVPKYL